MRISDWSSDVCSSDLSRCRWRRLPCNCTEASEHGYGHGGRSMKRRVLAPYSQTPIAIISFRTSAGETALRDENSIIAGQLFAAHLARRLGISRDAEDQLPEAHGTIAAAHPRTMPKLLPTRLAFLHNIKTSQNRHE